MDSDPRVCTSQGATDKDANVASVVAIADGAALRGVISNAFAEAFGILDIRVGAIAML